MIKQHAISIILLNGGSYVIFSTYWCVLRRVAGWVAGGRWDDDITNVMTGIIPENSLRKTHQ